MTQPVRYMQKTRDYYFAQGFEKPYRWAQNDITPWHRLTKPLKEATVAFITTAVPDGDIPKLSRTASSHTINNLPETFRTDELSWDKEATHTRDKDTYIPLRALQALEVDCVIGRLAKRFHFVPTEYSQTNTINIDAPAILKACQEDEVDIAILVPL